MGYFEKAISLVEMMPNYRIMLPHTFFCSQTGGATQVNVEIVGTTYFGVRHGLETLGQLIAYDEFNKCLRVRINSAVGILLLVRFL